MKASSVPHYRCRASSSVFADAILLEQMASFKSDRTLTGSAALAILPDFSGSDVKARLYQEAAEFCRKKGGVMVPLNSTGQEIPFQSVCLHGR